MAAYRAGQSTGELGTSYAGKAKKTPPPPKKEEKMETCHENTEDMSKMVQMDMLWTVVVTKQIMRVTIYKS